MTIKNGRPFLTDATNQLVDSITQPLRCLEDVYLPRRTAGVPGIFTPALVHGWRCHHKTALAAYIDAYGCLVRRRCPAVWRPEVILLPAASRGDDSGFKVHAVVFDGKQAVPPLHGGRTLVGVQIDHEDAGACASDDAHLTGLCASKPLCNLVATNQGVLMLAPLDCRSLPLPTR